MKNLKNTFLAVVLTMFVGTVMQAQEKAKDVRTKNQSSEINSQLTAEDAEHARMLEMFDRARAQAKSDEERTMIDKKQAAYEDLRNNNTLERRNSEEMQQREVKSTRAELSKMDQLKQAYAETEEVEYKLEASNMKIKEAKERLEAAKRSQSLTAEEITEKEAKLRAADKELQEAKQALQNQRRVIKEKHAELEDNN